MVRKSAKRSSFKCLFESGNLSRHSGETTEPKCKKRKVFERTMSASSSSSKGLSKNTAVIDLTEDSVVDLTDTSDYEANGLVILDEGRSNDAKVDTTAKNKKSDDISITRTEPPPRVW